MVQNKVEPPKTPRRGRPRQYDPDRALGDAAETFWQRGYAATSLDDLAAATGINRPSLYAAFGDKHELYLKTLERYRAQARAIGAQIVADDPPLRVFLKRFYDAAIVVYLGGGNDARGCYSISTAPAQATLDPAVRAFLADSIRGTDAFLCNRLGKARERGEVAACADPSALAQIATATMHTLAVRSRAGTSRKELKAIAATAIDLICRPESSGEKGSRSSKRIRKNQEGD